MIAMALRCPLSRPDASIDAVRRPLAGRRFFHVRRSRPFSRWRRRVSEAETAGEQDSAWSRRHTRLDGFYRRHSAWLVARLRRRFGADTEDLVQEIWLRVEAIEAEMDIRHPRAFLLQIAFNLGLSGDRQTRRRRQILDSTVPLGTATHHPTQTAVVEIQEIVLALPQPLRDVFVLSRFGGFTNSQIGEKLGISPKTVEWRMTKALAQCAAELRR